MVVLLHDTHNCPSSCAMLPACSAATRRAAGHLREAVELGLQAQARDAFAAAEEGRLAQAHQRIQVPAQAPQMGTSTSTCSHRA